MCWAVAGTFEGDKFGCINVTPQLEKGTILFTVTTEAGLLKPVTEVPFPPKDQTFEIYFFTINQVIGNKLGILL